LQETRCINNIESKWRKEWGGNSFWNNGTKAQKGVAVLFKEGFKYNVNVNNTDQNAGIGIYNVNLKLIPMKYLELQMYMYQTYPVTGNVF